MLTELTIQQHGTLADIQKTKLRGLAFLGVDSNENPVIWIHDQRRRFPMAVLPDGCGRFPKLPVRPLSSTEIRAMTGDDQDRLLCMDEVVIHHRYLTEYWDELPPPNLGNRDTTWPGT